MRLASSTGSSSNRAGRLCALLRDCSSPDIELVWHFLSKTSSGDIWGALPGDTAYEVPCRLPSTPASMVLALSRGGMFPAIGSKRVNDRFDGITGLPSSRTDMSRAILFYIPSPCPPTRSLDGLIIPI